MFLLQLLLQGPIQFSQKSCLGVYHGPSPGSQTKIGLCMMGMIS